MVPCFCRSARASRFWQSQHCCSCSLNGDATPPRTCDAPRSVPRPGRARRGNSRVHVLMAGVAGSHRRHLSRLLRVRLCGRPRADHQVFDSSQSPERSKGGAGSQLSTFRRSSSRHWSTLHKRWMLPPRRGRRPWAMLFTRTSPKPPACLSTRPCWGLHRTPRECHARGQSGVRPAVRPFWLFWL